MNIALIGPPGAGKGTLAAQLVTEFNVPHISTGDLFHDNLENKTALGLLARNYMNRGELVPDEVADAMVEQWLLNVPAESGVLFDGFPRTLYQAHFLDEVFQQGGRRLDAVIYLKVSDGVVIERLAERWICSTCNTPYHVRSKPPARTGFCDLCSGELHQRPDDTPDLVRARLRAFHRTSGPVLEHYQAAHQLLIFNGESSALEVFQAVAAALRAAPKKDYRPATHAEIKALQPPRPVPLLPEEVSRPGMDIVLLGGPGCGKGTQAEHLCREFAIPHISTGDLFRDNLKRATDLGKLAKNYMDRGELVPDVVTEGMVEQRLVHEDTHNGYVLDGFPRTLPQAHALDEMLNHMGRRLSGAIAIEVSDRETIERLSARRICSQCQASYHLAFKPPVKPGVCDVCGGALRQREDDNPATIATRLKTYHAQIQPLADYYHDRGLLVKVNGEGKPADVTARVIAAAKSFIPKGTAYV